MFELEITSSIENYRIKIDSNFPLEMTRYDFLVADSFFEDKLSTGNPKAFFSVATESNKNLTEVEEVCRAMLDSGVIRSSRVLAVGGGYIQDLATMACSIYMRGLEWDYLPTTLTAMADSCIGGKSSINLQGAKNILGNIHPPANIFIDPSYLESLSKLEIISGLMEAAKICFARGPDSFSKFLSHPSSKYPASVREIDSLIALSIESKKWFVETDEFDRNERQLLNFGHSFGHAIESATEFRITHGLAVGIGMLAAISHPRSGKSELNDSLASYILELLQPLRVDIENHLEKLDWEDFERTLSQDKKNSRESICHILPLETGRLEKIYIPRSSGAIMQSRDALKLAIDSIKKGKNFAE